MFRKQECIPVGRVPSAAVAISGGGRQTLPRPRGLNVSGPGTALDAYSGIVILLYSFGIFADNLKRGTEGSHDPLSQVTTGHKNAFQ